MNNITCPIPPEHLANMAVTVSNMLGAADREVLQRAHTAAFMYHVTIVLHLPPEEPTPVWPVATGASS